MTVNVGRAHNFVGTSYVDVQGKARPCYQMTRDGFSRLVMGFTGEKAGLWVEPYIEAFNRMEAELRTGSVIPQDPELLLSRALLLAHRKVEAANARVLALDDWTVTGGPSARRRSKPPNNFAPGNRRPQPKSASGSSRSSRQSPSISASDRLSGTWTSGGRSAKHVVDHSGQWTKKPLPRAVFPCGPRVTQTNCPDSSATTECLTNRNVGSSASQPSTTE